ncbi:sporulation membrane protein YtaF [Neobacillus ginsengisoli]|uniref:Sporulation protein YtaF n=1 Tax=Neobacillus ginsengisoli TaxID=904295 RepID=A0ABT9Y1E9_9BACI|nr:sporulation membrane protein YtaF [Neobacillus ginsengisoli]MDQ0201564.1 putative sporulation protein YtaF [Neobacillus ginsengisoli]
MHWLTILLIGVAANLDNLGISVSYGLKSTRIPFVSNIVIAVISMLCAYISITAGEYISQFISLTVANYAGGLLIIFLGGKCVVESIFPKSSPDPEPASEPVPVRADSNLTKVISQPALADINEDKVISFKESILLGLALAMNCLAMGLGAGFTGISPILTTISIGVFSLISIFFGIKIGSKISDNRVGKYSNIIAGLILILIGIYEIII